MVGKQESVLPSYSPGNSSCACAVSLDRCSALCSPGWGRRRVSVPGGGRLGERVREGERIKGCRGSSGVSGVHVNLWTVKIALLPR